MKRSVQSGIAVVALLAGSLTAQGDETPKPAYKAAPVATWDWTGFYLGGYAGVGVTRSHGLDPLSPQKGELDHIGSGFTGGGTIGYNWQFAPNWIAGVEGDVGYLGLRHNVRDYFEAFRFGSETSWIATLRGRLGYTNGPTLSYITGGGAWVHVKDTVNLFPPIAGVSEATRRGYTIGSGLETMLGGNWTAKAEYAFVDVAEGEPLTIINVEADKHRYHLIRYGVNYRFGGRSEPALPVNNWTGFYAGIVGGGTVAEVDAADPTRAIVGNIGNNGSGFTFGGQAGYNWQFARNWVAGVEGDFSYLGIDRSALDWFPDGALGVKTDWIATLRGRLGYSTGPALLYVTGGAAWVKVRDSWQSVVSFGPLVSSTSTLSGYTIGGGIEAVLARNWTTKAEYLFVDGGEGDPLASGGLNLQADHKFHLFRAGLSYKFD